MSSKYRSSVPPIKNFTQCAIEIIRPKNNAQIGKGTSNSCPGAHDESPYRLGCLLTDKASVVVECCYRWCHQQIIPVARQFWESKKYKSKMSLSEQDVRKVVDADVTDYSIIHCFV